MIIRWFVNEVINFLWESRMREINKCVKERKGVENA